MKGLKFPVLKFMKGLLKFPKTRMEFARIAVILLVVFSVLSYLGIVALPVVVEGFEHKNVVKDEKREAQNIVDERKEQVMNTTAAPQAPAAVAEAERISAKAERKRAEEAAAKAKKQEKKQSKKQRK